MRLHSNLATLPKTPVQFGALRDIFNPTSVKEAKAQNQKLETIR